MNRQFLSLLRSEQESHSPVIGDPRTFSKLLGENARLTTLDEAFAKRYEELLIKGIPPRKFPYWFTLRLVLFNPRIIIPGLQLAWEIIWNYAAQQFGWKNGKETSVVTLLHNSEKKNQEISNDKKQESISAVK